jgi:hypothetical protein
MEKSLLKNQFMTEHFCGEYGEVLGDLAIKT